jgi:hypothetical protein
VDGALQLINERLIWNVPEGGLEYHSSSRRQRSAPLPTMVLRSVLCPEQGPVLVTARCSLVSSRRRRRRRRWRLATAGRSQHLIIRASDRRQQCSAWHASSAQPRTALS